MKESTKALFVRPLIIQEIIIISILTPIVLFFFRYVSLSVASNFVKVSILAGTAANFGLFVGITTKYILVKPALEIMDKESYTASEMQNAVRSLSILPLVESIVTFLRFGLSGNLIANVTLYHLGCITYPEFLGSTGIVFMIGILAVPNVYLCAENSLTWFYKQSNLKGVMDTDTHLFRMSLSKKVLFTILFICAPSMAGTVILITLAAATGIEVSSLKMGFYVLLAESVCLAFIAGGLLMKNLSLSLGTMSVMFKDMAKGRGDLTKRLSVTGLSEVGELAFWFNEFLNDMEEIIEHVSETSLELHRTAQDVNEGSRGLSNETQQQAASVEEISSSIEEMNLSIRKNAELVVEGRDTSNAVTRLVDQNKEVFSNLSNAIREISQDSQKIGDIVSTVNEVAFHTNLLALNASVEAARAGEHGKGFAVVAGEVRSLAQRSAQAASEIKSLIEGTVGRIKNGDDMMKKTSSSLEELMSRMEFFFRMMEIIGCSSEEQMQSIDELSKAVTQIDRSAQHSAGTAEELAGTLDALRGMAVVLAEDVQRFKTSKSN